MCGVRDSDPHSYTIRSWAGRSTPQPNLTIQNIRAAPARPIASYNLPPPLNPNPCLAHLSAMDTHAVRNRNAPGNRPLRHRNQQRHPLTMFSALLSSARHRHRKYSRRYRPGAAIEGTATPTSLQASRSQLFCATTLEHNFHPSPSSPPTLAPACISIAIPAHLKTRSQAKRKPSPTRTPTQTR